MTIRCPLLVVASACLTVGLTGCAGGGRTSSALRPSGGPGMPFLPGGPGMSGRANGPVIQPGLQAFPALPPSSSPVIQPGPALPDASGRKVPSYPESAAARGPRRGQDLPSIAPRPQPGTPVATDDAPAALSGRIEIVPGPSIRAHRARMEVLPPSRPVKGTPEVEILPPPGGATVEELPAP